MLKMLVVLLAVAGLAVVVILGIATTRPATFHVERSITIAAAPDRVAPLVADLHHWDQWSPWARLDPNMRTTYSGPPSGAGAVYEWKGNRKVGEGRMEVLAATPAQTSLRLDFLSPFESHNTSTFA